MFEEAPQVLRSEEEVVALYAGQWEAFQKARCQALKNTRIYLSLCNDLDVDTSQPRCVLVQDFRDMASTCQQI